MKLAYAPTSPYVRKVMLLLHATDKLDAVELDRVVVTPTTENAAYRSQNPLGKVPALTRAEGPTLYDSRVITAYLDDHFRAGLYPAGARRWETLTLEATADGITDAALLMTYEARLRPDDKRWDAWTEGQWAKIRAGCDTLNARWMSHLSGPLDMGQYAVACALAYVDFRHGGRDWRSGNETLTEWFAAFDSRDDMVATAPPEG